MTRIQFSMPSVAGPCDAVPFSADPPLATRSTLRQAGASVTEKVIFPNRLAIRLADPKPNTSAWEKCPRVTGSEVCKLIYLCQASLTYLPESYNFVSTKVVIIKAVNNIDISLPTGRHAHSRTEMSVERRLKQSDRPVGQSSRKTDHRLRG
jgi:hypothetical protein